jgi:hypothetical protein
VTLRKVALTEQLRPTLVDDCHVRYVEHVLCILQWFDFPCWYWHVKCPKRDPCVCAVMLLEQRLIKVDDSLAKQHVNSLAFSVLLEATNAKRIGSSMICAAFVGRILDNKVSLEIVD